MRPDPSAITEEALPVVSVVFLAYDRRDALLVSLRQMVDQSGYPPDRLEVIVVDNASSDGTAEAVAETFPQVRIVRNQRNEGAPAWNHGFAVARGDYVLILDDDAYMRPGGLETAVRAARAEQAELVSFSVVTSFDEDHRLNDDWVTGLLSFWGCAALVGADVLRSVGGYDPDIFIWANEVDLTMRLLDRGCRHLYLPDVYAVHMKEAILAFEPRRYHVNARHHSYIAGKLMRPADALITVANILQRAAVDALTEDRGAAGAVKEALAGFGAGLRRRRPVRPVVSAAYRRNFHPFASPWRFMRTPADRLLRRDEADARRAHRVSSFYAERPAYYPPGRGSLQL